MFNKSGFDQTSFNLSGSDELGFYATLQSEFGVQPAPLRVRVHIPGVSINALSSMAIGQLWLRAPIAGVTMSVTFGLDGNMTARMPIGAVTLDVESELIVHMGARMPFGNTVVPVDFSVIAPLKAKMPLPTMTFRAETGAQCNLSALVPIAPCAMNVEYRMGGTLYCRIPFPDTTVQAELSFSGKALRTNESEEMVLEGLNLAPGQRLIIDTDTLEIEVDNEVRLDCWVTGGSFFQLKNGENVLSFSDNASQRQLVVTALWADRYL